MTYQEIQRLLQIVSGSIHEISHVYLPVRRIILRWQHNLTDVHKQARVEWSHDMINKFDVGSFRSV